MFLMKQLYSIIKIQIASNMEVVIMEFLKEMSLNVIHAIKYLKILVLIKIFFL